MPRYSGRSPRRTRCSSPSYFRGCRSVLLVLDDTHAWLGAKVAALARAERTQVVAFVETDGQDPAPLEPLVAVARVVFEVPRPLHDASPTRLVQAVRGLIAATTEMNLDLRDVVKQRGRGRLALGRGEGEGAASTAARRAISSPLLDGAAVREFRRVTLVSRRGLDSPMDDVAEAAAIVQERVHPKADLQLVGLLDGAVVGMELAVYCA